MLVSYNRGYNRHTLARIHFFEKVVHLEGWKNSMTGYGEIPFVDFLVDIGYEPYEDFMHQYPIGYAFVLDFAFVNEKVCIEIDGKSHETKKQKQKDKMRDSYLNMNDWCVIRIRQDDFAGYKKSFYKHLIHDIVNERREQYNTGVIYKIDEPYFIQEDYE